MNFRFVGVDIAKNVFQVHGADESGHGILRKSVGRSRFLSFMSQIEPTVVGMEACSSAHYWARRLAELGHEVRLMPPAYVKPYVKTNKNDAADAEAICEAVQRPTMRFVKVKTPDQQAVLLLHRARRGFVKARTACANQIRGILGEFGLVVPVGIERLPKQAQSMIDDTTNEIPALCRRLLGVLIDQLRGLQLRIRSVECELLQWHREDITSQRISSIPGIGLLGATAIAASIGDASQFRNGRQLSAWLGIVPKQRSSGGKDRLLGISKHGDAYLRTLLIHGARSVLAHEQRRPEAKESWHMRLSARSCINKAATGLANKMARTIWALIRHERTYEPGFRSTRSLGCVGAA